MANYDKEDQREMFAKCYIVTTFLRVDETHYESNSYLEGTGRDAEARARELSASGWAVRITNPSVSTVKVFAPYDYEFKNGSVKRANEKRVA